MNPENSEEKNKKYTGKKWEVSGTNQNYISTLVDKIKPPSWRPTKEIRVQDPGTPIAPSLSNTPDSEEPTASSSLGPTDLEEPTDSSSFWPTLPPELRKSESVSGLSKDDQVQVSPNLATLHEVIEKNEHVSNLSDDDQTQPPTTRNLKDLLLFDNCNTAIDSTHGDVKLVLHAIPQEVIEENEGVSDHPEDNQAQPPTTLDDTKKDESESAIPQEDQPTIPIQSKARVTIIPGTKKSRPLNRIFIKSTTPKKRTRFESLPMKLGPRKSSGEDTKPTIEPSSQREFTSLPIKFDRRSSANGNENKCFPNKFESLPVKYPSFKSSTPTGRRSTAQSKTNMELDESKSEEPNVVSGTNKNFIRMLLDKIRPPSRKPTKQEVDESKSTEPKVEVDEEQENVPTENLSLLNEGETITINIPSSPNT